MLLLNILKSNVLFSVFILLMTNCNSVQQTTKAESKPEQLQVGAQRTLEYLPQIQGKNVGLVVNQTSMMGEQHLVDFLVTNGGNCKIKRIFAPEHGFRGTADAGEHVADGKDRSTGLPIKSLYGANKKPSKEDLADLDVVIFDIQDVGARFYTYISTLHYVMDACALYGKKLIVLDRPNPNGHYVDGPVLEKKMQSFIGMDEIPIVHGMTVGELATMINSENWLESKQKCDLNVVKCIGYNHTNTRYEVPIAPSPNLKTMRSIYMYPTLCLFEGTEVSVGRGTDTPFEIWGSPNIKQAKVSFTPMPNTGNKDPFQNGKLCKGFSIKDLTTNDLCNINKIDLSIIMELYKQTEVKKNFFLANRFFDKLAGNETLRQQIIDGISEVNIRKTWQPQLDVFKQKRKKYLLYAE